MAVPLIDRLSLVPRLSSHERSNFIDCSMSLSNVEDEWRDRPIENVPRLGAAEVVLFAVELGSGKFVRDRDNMMRLAGAPASVVVGEVFGSSTAARFGFGSSVGLLGWCSPCEESEELARGGEMLPLGLNGAANSFGYYCQIRKY